MSFLYFTIVQDLQHTQAFKLTYRLSNCQSYFFKNPQESFWRFQRSLFALVHVSSNFFKFHFISSDSLLDLPFLISQLSFLVFSLFCLFEIGRFKYLEDSPALIEVFKEKYHILQEASLQYCPPEGIATDWEVGEVIIPMIAFIEGGMTFPMGRVTRDYLHNHRLYPHQCAPNLFRILAAIDALNQHLGLRLT